MKKIISLVLALIMLMGMMVCVPVSANTTLVRGDIENQIAEETDSDSVNLAFGIRANVTGMQSETDIGGAADYTNATVEYNGQTAQVIEMGVMVTNNVDLCANVEDLTVDAENNEDTIRIRAEYLYEKPEADSCLYVARVRNIPYYGRARELVARSYFVLNIGGNEEIIYSTVDRESYLGVWGRIRGVEVPAESSLDGVVLESVTPVYSLDPDDLHNVRMDAVFTVRNGNSAYTAVPSFVEYACYDANGAELQRAQINLAGIAAGDTVTFTESVPVETMKVAIENSTVTLLSLPAIGSDIDVTKKKNRIRVSAATAALNEDGTYNVSLTFKNYSNWITEETNYVKYTCYDANGNTVQTATTLYIGVIDTKKHPSKTFEFQVPANTASVKLTDSKIVYWTEWA